jgi:hypothetical protein
MPAREGGKRRHDARRWGTTSRPSKASRAQARAAADCAWLLHDLIRADPERMVDVERSMRERPGRVLRCPLRR